MIKCDWQKCTLPYTLEKNISEFWNAYVTQRPGLYHMRCQSACRELYVTSTKENWVKEIENIFCRFPKTYMAPLRSVPRTDMRMSVIR